MQLVFLALFFTIVMISIIALIIIKIIITYIFENIFLYKVSKREKYKYPFISFISPINKYYLGKIANSPKVSIYLVISYTFLLLFCLAFYITYKFDSLNPSLLKTIFDSFLNIMNYIPLSLIIILIIGNFISNIYLSHKIMKKTVGKNSTLFTVLNILTLGISRPIILFAIRNKV